MVVLIIFAFVILVISFMVVANAFSNLAVGLSYELSAKKHSLKNAEKEIHINNLKGPKIEYIEPKALRVGDSTHVGRGFFDNQNHKDAILNDISQRIGKELLDKKLINFDIIPEGEHYRIISQIKVYNDPSN